ncbi:acyl-CoA dehydrogenase [Pseudoclavibacter helvolus]|uniref:acyl-CoA dehydrogenase n=1 Tax=Pseudoclavibacter helvolus TaxID=255205 RepID=UPI003C7221D6
MSGTPRPTAVQPGFWPGCESLLAAAAACDGDAVPLLRALRDLPSPPVPGEGKTRALVQLLAGIAAEDVTAARVVEPHFDAAAILAQADHTAEPGATWGVFAAASPVEVTWTAELSGTGERRRAELSGTKRWCSLAAHLDRALVTARDSEGEWIFIVDLTHASVMPHLGGAPFTGLRGVPSGPIELSSTPATVVGAGPDWYTARPGFAWGGICVASVWFGGAVALGETLTVAASTRAPDQLALAWLGEADRLLHAARVQLDDAADRIDAGTADWALALRVRANVASTCRRLIAICGEALGPGPLAFDARHARRVADLQMYLAQHHGARDDEALGSLLHANGHGSSEWPAHAGVGLPS